MYTGSLLIMMERYFRNCCDVTKQQHKDVRSTLPPSVGYNTPLQYTMHTYSLLLLLVLSNALVLTTSSSSSSSTDDPLHRPLRFLVAPILGNSPAMDLMGVAAKLQESGNSVAVVVVPAALEFVKSAAARHSSNTTAEAMQYITLDLGIAARESAAADDDDNKQQQQLRKEAQQNRVTKTRFTVPSTRLRSLTIGTDLLMVIQDVLAEPCARILKNKDTLQQLLNFQADAVMAIGLPVTNSASDSCGCLLSHALNTPLIDINGGGLWTGPPSVPQFGTGLTPSNLKTPTGYTLNLVAYTLRHLTPLLSLFHPRSSSSGGGWKRVRNDLGLPAAASVCPLVNLLGGVRGRNLKQCEAVVEVILGSWLLEYPRPLAANQVLVGPGTPRFAHPITSPADMADFVNTAVDGLVLVAFGTSYQFNSWLSVDDFKELAQGLASLSPVRVLWNLNRQGLPDGVTLEELSQVGGNNMMIVPWVDYNDVLGHRNTKAFISHCGLHSAYEAAFHGVPVIGVPFMFEQAETCGKLAARGAAVVSHQAPAYRSRNHTLQYTREHIQQLVREVLNNSSYSSAAAAVSVALQLYIKQRHPYARAADEIQLAIRTSQAQQQLATFTKGSGTVRWLQQQRARDFSEL